MKLRVLQAKHGDALLISWKHEGRARSLLIDGGPKAAYVNQRRPGVVQEALDILKQREERIDLLILTHVDDDHIGGLLEGFKHNGLLRGLVDKVWFNSGSLIDQAFGQPIDESHLLEFDTVRTGTITDNQTSIKQGINFESVISELGIWNEQLIEAGTSLNFHGAAIKLLSPTREKLESLLVKWEKETKSHKTSAANKDYDLSFDELLAVDQFNGNTSIHNESSIALLFEYEGQRLLLLGDASDEVVLNSIRALKDNKGHFYSEDNPLEVDYVKLSHHGSQYNTSPDFLRMIKSKHFIISTDGSSHGLPNKRTLARVAKAHPNATFWFNYPNIINKIFTATELLQLEEDGYRFKNCDDMY